MKRILNGGKKWYTNRDTGESNSFLTAPNEKWILGRNLFHGETCRIPISKSEIIEKIRKGVINFYKYNDSPKKGKHYNKKKSINIKKLTVYNIITMEKLVITDGIIPENYTDNKKYAYYNSEKLKTQHLWDLFNENGYESLNSFSKDVNISQPLLTSKFRTYIPIYKKLSCKRFKFKTDKKYIGVYE